MSEYTSTCVICGITFEAKRKTAKYCKPYHRLRAWRFGLSAKREVTVKKD